MKALARALSFLFDEERFAGYCVNDPFGLNPCVEYIIAGYDSGAPVLISVKLERDWKRRTILPTRTLVQPDERERIDSRLGAFGVNSIVFEACNAHAGPYQKEISKFTAYAKAACDRAFADFTLDQASDLVRVLIGIEAEVHPDLVGFPLTVITLPKIGSGWVRNYCNSFPSSPSKLSRRHTCKQK